MDVGQLWYDWLDAVFGDIQFCGDGLPEHIEIDGEEQFLASFNDLSVNPLKRSVQYYEPRAIDEFREDFDGEFRRGALELTNDLQFMKKAFLRLFGISQNANDVVGVPDIGEFLCVQCGEKISLEHRGTRLVLVDIDLDGTFDALDGELLLQRKIEGNRLFKQPFCQSVFS